MSRLIFDKRLLQIIVLLAHLCLVALAVIFAQSFDDTTINRVMSLESVQADFDVIKLSYIGYAREIGHITSPHIDTYFLYSLSHG